jgi:hypothetical protein
MTDLAEKTKENPDMYRHAKAAAQFFNAKDVTSARKCLDKLVTDINPNTNPALLKGMVWNAYGDDPKATLAGIKRGIDLYASQYEEDMEALTINEMFERYSPEFNKYLSEEGKAKAGEAFAKLGDKTYAEVSKFIRKNSKIMQDEDSSEDEKKKAQKEIEKYADVFSTIQEFEELRISKLMPSIREDTIKGDVKERYKVEKKEEGKK